MFYGPSKGVLFVLLLLVLCGIVGVAYGSYELVVWFLQHVKFV